MARIGSNYHNANLLDDDDDDEVPSFRQSSPGAFPSPITPPQPPIRDLDELKLTTNLETHLDQEPTSPPPPTRPAPQLPGVSGQSRLVIAIDYGTTYTGLAFAFTNAEHADLRNVVVLQRWAGLGNEEPKVRSVFSYAAPTSGEAQWGSEISPSAITMVNTKLELEPLATRFDELDLTLQVLKGTGYLEFDHIRKSGPDPAYSTKTPTEIVTDYLRKILESYRAGQGVDDEFDQLVASNTPVDIVVTVPVDWSYQAHDSIFKAVRGAGFNKETFPTLKDTLLVPEPEAASYFTSRDLRERNANILREEDCFILCDAGGGTVDVISFQVKKLKPKFELEKATRPTGGNYGSSLIDTKFKGWLRDTIGSKHYAQLDPANARRERISPHTVETGAMRDLLTSFFDYKATFSLSKKSDINLGLPKPLDNLSIEGRVNGGHLKISWDEMRKLMDPCVNGVIELIKDQINKVSISKNRRVRNVFLVGGFGASPYLQEMLRKSLSLRKIELHRPVGVDANHADPSLTAVVQGGVIYGIEKTRHKDAMYMSAITRSYGVLHEGRFEWLIKKGDLVLSNQETTIQSKSFWLPAQSVVKGKYDFPIFYHLARSEDDDDFPEWWQDGRHDVERAGVVKCDFSNLLDRDLRPLPNMLMPGAHSPSSSRTSIGPLSWRLRLSTTQIIAEVLLKGSPLQKCEIRMESDWQGERRKSKQSIDSWREQDESD